VDFTTKLGSVSIVPQRRKEDKTVLCQANTAAYAHIYCHDDPTTIGMHINIIPASSDAKIYAVRDNTTIVEPHQGKFPFSVPVEWKRGAPKTRKRGMDNVDIHIVERDGRFVDIQCGVITRDSVFFLTAQQIWEGAVVRTRSADHKVKWDTVATNPIHAFPGANLQAVWSTMAEAFLDRTFEDDRSTPLSRVKVAKWAPPELPTVIEDGYQAGIVDYDNMITGTGQIHGADEVKRFFHYSDIENGGNVPTLTPMTVVLFKDRAPDPGKDRRPITTIKQYVPVSEEVQVS
jgi:hypothetical protein